MPSPAKFLVVFGGFGDLSGRYLAPSAAALNAGPFRDAPLRVLLASRQERSPADLGAFLAKSGVAPEARANFASVRADPADPASMAGLRELLERKGLAGGAGAFYLSVGPEAYAAASAALAAAGLARAPFRLLVEKPFGADLPSAKALAEALRKDWGERALLVDHYLAKPVFSALSRARLSHPGLAAAWAPGSVRTVRAVARETVGVGTRAAYYDRSGAFRDMVQNHLLNVAADALARPGHPEDRAAAVDSAQFDAARALFGQYGPGVSGGENVPGYAAEPGVAAGSRTETFVRSRVVFQGPGGAVLAELETGKRLAEKETFVEVGLADGSRMRAEAAPRTALEWRRADGSVEALPVPGAGRNAYEIVLEDAFSERPTAFSDLAATLASWRAADRIVRCVGDACPRVWSYPAGSCGPEAPAA